MEWIIYIYYTYTKQIGNFALEYFPSWFEYFFTYGQKTCENSAYLQHNLDPSHLGSNQNYLDNYFNIYK